MPNEVIIIIVVEVATSLFIEHIPRIHLLFHVLNIIQETHI